MTIEKTLFAAADKMRGAMDAGEYKHIALGLLFLRYVSEAFDRRQTLIVADGGDAEDRDEYLAENTFFVPPAARWASLAAQSKDARIGVMIDDAMRQIEAENPSLKGALPKVFGRESIDRAMLTGLIDLFSNLKLDGSKNDFDLIGRIYEYCIGEFASSEGKRGGEFYTPKSVVDTLIEMIEPTKGRVYDPCCGTGGFFVQSEKFIDAHQGKTDDIAIYGQERNHTTFGLARMNLAIRSIFADIRWNSEGTLLRDEFPDERFDYILANPPFNISDWSGNLLREDARWRFGAPPVGNANFAWIQHIHAHPRRAYRVGRWLVEKATARLRRDGRVAGRFSLSVSMLAGPVWSRGVSCFATQDTAFFLRLHRALWRSLWRDGRPARIFAESSPGFMYPTCPSAIGRRTSRWRILHPTF